MAGELLGHTGAVPDTAQLMTDRQMWQRYYDARVDRTYLRMWQGSAWSIAVYAGNVVPACCQ